MSGTITRTKDVSEQKESIRISGANVNNATTLGGYLVERSMIITDCKVAMQGVSGSPSVMLGAYRFQGSTGSASFVIGTSFVVTSYATSGYMSYSLPASGSTLLQLMKGDVIVIVQGGGTGAASTYTSVDVVAQNIQDIRTWF